MHYNPEHVFIYCYSPEYFPENYEIKMQSNFQMHFHLQIEDFNRTIAFEGKLKIRKTR